MGEGGSGGSVSFLSFLNLDSSSEHDLSRLRGAVPFLPSQILANFRKQTAF